ncbi:MAG: type II toxin-antitoxin system PemK/MazF family toxin [Bacteroidales bacterium]|nr:type II toxin-antitoxin system PemK/MazF family toxin [Bacteroidales bacterium]
MEIKQNEIVLVNLDPVMGSDIKRTCQCLVISPDEMNRHLRTVVVVPLLTSSKNYPTRIEIRHDKRTYLVALDQVRTIERRRIVKELGRLSKPEIKEVKAILKEIYID